MQLEIKRERIQNDTDLAIEIGYAGDWPVLITVRDAPSGDIGAAHDEARALANKIISLHNAS